MTFHEDRAAAIGALKRLTAWLESHPEAPAPVAIEARYVATVKTEPNEAIRMAAVLSTGGALGATFNESDTGLVATVTVAEGLPGPRAQYLMIGIKDDHQAPRYLEMRCHCPAHPYPHGEHIDPEEAGQ